MGERAMNFLALRSSAIPKITTGVLQQLAAQAEVNRAHAEGRVFVFETNIAPMRTRRGPGSTFDLEWELALQSYLGKLDESEFRMVRVFEGGQCVDYRGEWNEHPFHAVEAVASIQAEFEAVMRLSVVHGAHPACTADVRVNSGALNLALNVLRRAGKSEVANELQITAQREPSTDQELIAEINRLVLQTRKQVIEPFSIQVNDQVDVELRPLADDARVIVGHKEWGHTVVNYTTEGVIVDTYAHESLDSAQTFAISSDELCDQAAEQLSM